MNKCHPCDKCCYKTIDYLDVELSAQDIINIPEELREERLDSWWMRRNEDESCIALNLKTKKCSIQQIKPQECRSVVRESELCKLAIKWYNVHFIIKMRSELKHNNIGDRHEEKKDSGKPIFYAQ